MKKSNIKDQITIIKLVYEEDNTSDQLQSSFDWVVYAYREGVGSMSAAFMRAFMDAEVDTPYTWFVTDVNVTLDMAEELIKTLEEYPACAAIHPRVRSDHPFMQYCYKPNTVPFLEWICPLVRTPVIQTHPLNIRYSYDFFDIEWSRRVQQWGHEVMVHPVKVRHTYLRHLEGEHEITNIRRLLRAYRTKEEEEYLKLEFGKDWQVNLWPTHPKSLYNILR